MADVQSILQAAQIPQSAKADAWDAYYSAANEDDLAARLQKLSIPKSVMADLWDAKRAEGSAPIPDLAARQAASKAEFERNQSLANPLTNPPGLAKPGEILSPLEKAKRLGQLILNPTKAPYEEGPLLGEESPGSKPMIDLSNHPYMQDALSIARSVLDSGVPGTAIRSALPSAVRAGANMQKIEEAAKAAGLISETSGAVPSAQRAAELVAHGYDAEGAVPLTKFMQRVKPGTVQTGKDIASIEPPPLSYAESEDFRKAAGEVLGKATTKEGMSGSMQAQLKQFYGALKTANRAAADSIGMGQLYDSAIKEFRQAKTIEQAVKVAAKWGIGAIVGTGATAAGIKLYRDLTQ